MMRTILPPAKIGVIGGGQLGMMTVREAHRMGFRSIVWDPDPECPAARLADTLLTAPFSDPAAARSLADTSDIVTYEFESIDPGMVEMVEKTRPVFPGSSILRIARHRRLEKEALQNAGFPSVPFSIARTANELRDAAATIGFPVVVKTTTAGYDGKGQAVLENAGDLDSFCAEGGSSEWIVEQFLPLLLEVSVIAVRGHDGGVTAFPVIENEHRENILHVSRIPARISAALRTEARNLGISVIKHFNIVGVLCIEMFVTRDGKLLVNELAPRPHNSGHFSLDACSMSQFEALVRTIVGLPMQEPRTISPCAMVNLLGKHLEQLDIVALHEIPEIKVHLYGKKRIEPKRKMGHVTVLGVSEEEVGRKVERVQELIGEKTAAGRPPRRKSISVQEKKEV
ncbi:MAG: 5-(carboxyamino)imidazole ribonucleotide synthase [Bacteroidota bacterium]